MLSPDFMSTENTLNASVNRVYVQDMNKNMLLGYQLHTS